MGLPLYFLGFLGLYNPVLAIYNIDLTFLFSVNINKVMAKMGAAGGMSLTTSYRIKFARAGGTNDAITMMCDEAQLPNVQAATAQMAGRYLGEGPFQYPHTRLFTDVSLGFLCDAELTQLKYFQVWYDEIFGANGQHIIKDKATVEEMHGTGTPNRFRTNRLNYPANYTATTYITKVEQRATDVPSVTYMLEGSYPYAIDAVPLSYGSSQVTRVNVNFHYVRHSMIYSNGMGGLTGAETQVFND